MADQKSSLSLVGSKVLVCSFPCPFLWLKVHGSLMTEGFRGKYVVYFAASGHDGKHRVGAAIAETKNPFGKYKVNLYESSSKQT